MRTLKDIRGLVEDLNATVDRHLGDQSIQPPTKDMLPMGTGFQTDPDAPRPYDRWDGFLKDVVRAGTPDGPVSDELRQLQRYEEKRATGMSEAVGSEGGFLVPPNFSQELLMNIWSDGGPLERVAKFPLTTGNSLTIPRVNETSRADGSRFGGLQAAWKSEGALKPDSKPDFGQVELKLKKLVALVYLTDELIEDTPALTQYVKAMATAEIRFKLTDALINGTGAGQPLGVLNAGCLVTVAKESGQTAATIVAENLVNMWSRMIASSRKNAIWCVNPDVEPQLLTLGITVGMGGSPIFMPAGGLSQSPYNQILGRPIIPLEQCSTLGTVGDIVFADWGQYVAIEKGGLQVASSIHVKFVYDETALRFVYRFDGEPWPASAVTPYSGSSNTLSPFVTLATRE